jgi:hypothetical protein
MRPLIRDLWQWAAVALLGATARSLLLAWVASLPRIGPISIGAACERQNTPGAFVSVFALIMAPGIVLALLRELRRRLDAWSTISPAPDPRAARRLD